METPINHSTDESTEAYDLLAIVELEDRLELASAGEDHRCPLRCNDPILPIEF